MLENDLHLKSQGLETCKQVGERLTWGKYM